MNIPIGLPLMAPQITGHPAGLPADPIVAKSSQKIVPAGEKSGSSSAQSRQNSEQRTAPPSAMQLKIMEMLERQAAQLNES